MTTRDTPEWALAAALTTYRDGMTPREYAAAILAALDSAGWTLTTVPSPGESAGYDREQAIVATLRAALARYGRHDTDCQRATGTPCFCGLSALVNRETP